MDELRTVWAQLARPSGHFARWLSSRTERKLHGRLAGSMAHMWPESPAAGRKKHVAGKPFSHSVEQTRSSHILLAEDGHIFLTDPQLVGTWVQNMFRNLVPDFLTCPQLVGTWVKNMFRNLVPDFLAHTPWRIPPYEKYPRKGVLARGRMHSADALTYSVG